MTKERFDLIIIGSGSGNSLLSRQWPGAGQSVAIIEAGTFGGTCLNVGCIPTKMFVYPSELARACAVEAPRLGVGAAPQPGTLRSGVHWRQIRDRIFGRIDPISRDGRDYRAQDPAVTLIEDHVRFTGPKTLRTSSGRNLEGQQIVIAAGSHPVLPQIPGIGLPQVHTSDTVMRLDELPRRVLVVGSGVIAAEFAAIFSGFGAEVSQMIRGTRLLRSADPLISERFTAAASRQWRLLPEHVIERIDPAQPEAINPTTKPTTDAVRVQASGGFREDFDVVLLAIGRAPSTAGLDVGAAGFDTRASGALAVDEYQRVLSGGAPVPGVWALGDIANDYQLKHVANHEARIVAHNAAHPGDLRAARHDAVPAAIFTHPQIAILGMTSPQAQAHAEQTGAEVVEYIQDYGSTAYGWAMEDSHSVAKVIAEKATGRLLGAHLIGPEASTLIQPLIQAMSFNIDLRRMARGQYWIHPALTEVVENAALGLDLDPLPDAPV